MHVKDFRLRLQELPDRPNEESARGVGAAPPADEPFSEPQHLRHPVIVLVAIVDDDGVDGEADVLYREVQVGLTVEPATPVGAELVQAVNLAGRLAETADDVRGREDHVLGVVGQDAIEVVSVPGCHPLLREPESEFGVHGRTVEVGAPAPLLDGAGEAT